MMKKPLRKMTAVIALSLLLASCGNLEKGTTNLNTTQVDKEASITTGRVDSNAYQSLMENGKYVTSAARGLSASRLNSDYNLRNFQDGLLRLSKGTFSTDKYYLQEGQQITADTIKEWYGRKSSDNPDGLNPGDEASPIIFQQVEEYDFLNTSDQKLAGISLGIALNSVYYTDNSQAAISDADIEAKGKEVAQSILSAIRGMKGMEDVPIMIALYQQSSRENIAGGRYIMTTTSKGDKVIGNWETVNESYASLPAQEGQSNEATESDVSTKFNDFKDTVQGFFPNLSGVSGVAHFVDGTLDKLSIEITSKYYSRGEIVSFTQYIGKITESQVLSVSGDVEILINSIDGPQAFISKNAGENEVFSQVFH